MKMITDSIIATFAKEFQIFVPTSAESPELVVSWNGVYTLKTDQSHSGSYSLEDLLAQLAWEQEADTHSMHHPTYRPDWVKLLKAFTESSSKAVVLGFGRMGFTCRLSPAH